MEILEAAPANLDEFRGGRPVRRATRGNLKFEISNLKFHGWNMLARNLG
jgi:hypothetical protein